MRRYNQTGRVGLPPATVATQQQTVNQDSPELIWNRRNAESVRARARSWKWLHAGYGWAYST